MIKSFKIETVAARAFLAGAILLCLTAVFFFAKWCFAHAIAARAPAREVAELAVSLAPNDPQSHYAAAILNAKSFALEDSAKALAEFERAVALAPHDYRLWVALGKARERGGDAAGAESALRKASELAPNYAAVRWMLGNIILRRGERNEEAFAELIRAAENDKNYRLPAINTAWQLFGGDFESVRRHIGTSATINSALALFLVKQKRFEDAVRIWENLPADEQKTVYRTDGEMLFSELIAAKKFRSALQIWRTFDALPEAEKFALGKVYNGGFETTLERVRAGVFDWQIADGAQPQIGPNDEQKNGGNRSLFIIFNSYDGKDFRAVSQTVAVESGRQYALDFFYKSDLKTAATLRWEIADAADGKVIAAANPIAAKANWTNLRTVFSTAATTEAVTIRLARDACKSIVCPITGKVWFDDFSIE